MKKIKVLCVFGTRPEIIKLWPVIVAAKEKKHCIVETCFTGQHGHLGPQMMTLLDIVPKYHVTAMREGQSLAELTGRLFPELDTVFSDSKPDIVLVQGDTTTVFVGAMVAFYHRIKVGHVEAGLRTSNKFSPFPEEINRRLVSPIADFNFAPTIKARDNLLSEGVNEESITVTGNTAIDALMLMVNRIDAGNVPCDPALQEIPDGDRVVLVTAHRRENFEKGIENICLALKELSKKFPDLHIVYPVHPNPNVLKPVNQIIGSEDRIHLIKPREYASFVQMMRRANLILTDSGGIQEEAPSLGKPVLVLRDTTERPEGLEAGTLKLVGTSTENIVNWTSRLLTDHQLYQSMSCKSNPYGDGHAAQRIIDTLQARL